ncbi:MAG: hypothetical protein JOZ81_10650, partial [Chloroflexi bacterium]|nr:hypothetical protein [Chloroflexota bacterium]
MLNVMLRLQRWPTGSVARGGSSKRRLLRRGSAWLICLLFVFPASLPASLVQAASPLRANWPQFRYDARHSGTNPFEHVLSPFSVSRLQLDWTAKTGAVLISSPAV